MDRTYPCGEGTVNWVDTAWLESHLGDKNLAIIDVQPDVHDYFKRHIPGAVYMHEGLLRAPAGTDPAHYLPTDAIRIIFRQVGIRADVPTVVYTGTGAFKGWGDGLEQTMAAYTLQRFGHRNVLVLDGGVDRWVAERRTLSKDFPDVRPSDFEPRVNTDCFIEYDEFREIKDRDDVALLDVRPANFYEGQGPWKKPGHIPGALNLPWQSLMDKTNKRLFKPDQEIRDIVGQLGLDRDKLAISSCGTGREATSVYLILKHYLGFPKVKIYEGSFTEWVAKDNPTVTGKTPREAAARV